MHRYLALPGLMRAEQKLEALGDQLRAEWALCHCTRSELLGQLVQIHSVNVNKVTRLCPAPR